MADPNPMHDPRVTPIDLPDEHRKILRTIFTDFLAGTGDELRYPKRLSDAAQARRDFAAYERLLAGIDDGQLSVPDDDARVAVQGLAAGFDRASEYESIKREHDALHGLLGLLLGGELMWRRPSGRGQQRMRLDSITHATELKLRRLILATVSATHPPKFTFHSLCEEILEPPVSGLASSALARAVRDLVTVGLLQSNGLYISPTDAAVYSFVLQVA